MKTKVRIGDGITEGKTEKMRKKVTIPVTINNETNDFEITLRYEEIDDSYCDRLFLSYQIEGKSIRQAWVDPEGHADYTEGLNEDIGDWLNEYFTLNEEQLNQELEQLFDMLWVILEDENLAY